MIEFKSNLASLMQPAASSSGEVGVAIDQGNQFDERDFQAMVDNTDSSESWAAPKSEYPASGPMDLVRNVETTKATAQAALLRVSISNKPEDIQAAAVALSSYDIQTLFLSKVANKALQAVDRLTNLQ